MDPFTAMAIAGVVSAGAGLGGTMMANDAREDAANSANQWGLWMQREGQMWNAQMAETTWLRNLEQWYRSVGYQQTMANTAYQRAMTDMRAAGLNPILAYQQGGAASPPAPSAVASSASTPGFSPGAKADVENAVAPAVNSAMNTVRTIQGVQSAQEAIQQTRANTNLQQVQAGREVAQTGLLTQQTASEGVRTGLLKEETARTAAQEGLVRAQEGLARASAGLVGEQTRTEQERQPLIREQTRREGAEANTARQRYEWDRDWGPSSAVRDAAVSAEQIQQRIDRLMREGLGPFLRIGQ